MNIVCQAHVPYNTGWSAEMKKGQVIRITATTTVDFVFFKLDCLRERFDQARRAQRLSRSCGSAANHRRVDLRPVTMGRGRF
jgi:hypothetical protein